MDREHIKNVLLITHELSMTGAPVALQYMARQLKETACLSRCCHHMTDLFAKNF